MLESIQDLGSRVQQELHLFDFDQSRSQYILFTGVNNDIFRRDFANPIDNSTEFEIYSIPDEIIMVKMESHTHAWAHCAFNLLLYKKLGAMYGRYSARRKTRSRCRHWLPFGGAEIRQWLRRCIDSWETTHFVTFKQSDHTPRRRYSECGIADICCPQSEAELAWPIFSSGVH